MSKQFQVKVARVTYEDITLLVFADSEEEAEAKAVSAAENSKDDAPGWSLFEKNYEAIDTFAVGE